MEQVTALPQVELPATVSTQPSSSISLQLSQLALVTPLLPAQGAVSRRETRVETDEDESTELPSPLTRGQTKRKLGVISCEPSSQLLSPSAVVGDGKDPLAIASIMGLLPPDRQNSMGEGSLNQMLEKLEAAEWHVVHRQQSIRHASLTELIQQTGRRNSGFSSRKSSVTAASTAEVSSTPGGAGPSLVRSNTISELTEFVNDAERRKREGSQQIQDLNNIANVRVVNVKDTERKKPQRLGVKRRKAQRAKRELTPHPDGKTLTSSSSTSLSALLREELRVATRERAAEVKRQASSSSHALIDRVARAEEKRKKVRSLLLTLSKLVRLPNDGFDCMCVCVAGPNGTWRDRGSETAAREAHERRLSATYTRAAKPCCCSFTQCNLLTILCTRVTAWLA